MALDKFKAAPLPNPPANWDPQYMRQVIRVLEMYFSQLDSNTPNHAEKYTADAFVGGSFTGTDIVAETVDTNFLTSHTSVTGYERANGVWTDALISYGQRAGRILADDIEAGNFYGGMFYGDGRFLTTPYNQFQSTADQTAASVAVAYPITYTVSDFPDGISLSSSSHLNVSAQGIYRFDYSVSLENTTNDRVDVDIWYRRNGTDVPASNSRFSVAARKSTGSPSYLIATTPYMIDLQANDYVEIMWRTSDIGVTIQALPAVTASPGVTPAIPATPSVLVSAQFVSAQFPAATRVAPLPVFGFGQVGSIRVATS